MPAFNTTMKRRIRNSTNVSARGVRSGPVLVLVSVSVTPPAAKRTKSVHKEDLHNQLEKACLREGLREALEKRERGSSSHFSGYFRPVCLEANYEKDRFNLEDIPSFKEGIYLLLSKSLNFQNTKRRSRLQATLDSISIKWSTLQLVILVLLGISKTIFMLPIVGLFKCNTWYMKKIIIIEEPWMSITFRAAQNFKVLS